MLLKPKRITIYTGNIYSLWADGFTLKNQEYVPIEKTKVEKENVEFYRTLDQFVRIDLNTRPLDQGEARDYMNDRLKLRKRTIDEIMDPNTSEADRKSNLDYIRNVTVCTFYQEPELIPNRVMTSREFKQYIKQKRGNQ